EKKPSQVIRIKVTFTWGKLASSKSWEIARLSSSFLHKVSIQRFKYEELNSTWRCESITLPSVAEEDGDDEDENAMLSLKLGLLLVVVVVMN
ncbi:hypothetical protein SDJN02_20319, partial [Cucurbita argyrosperma subsp. argyrosperma]